MERRRSFMLLLVVVAGSLAANADTHYVALDGDHVHPYTNWMDAATNIQSAVDAAGSGDTVLVGSGFYRISSQLVVTNGIALSSSLGPAATVVDAAYEARCLYLSATGAAVTGFTFVRGSANAPGSTEPGFGGGVYAKGGMVADCVVSNCMASEGGGIFLESGGMATDCHVCFNSSGGIAGIVAVEDSEIRSCMIEYNVASWLSIGGAGCSRGSRIIASTVRWNEPGGVGLIWGSSATGCAVVDNEGSRVGLIVMGPDDRVVNCTISGNSAGGVEVWGESNLVQNCIISGNGPMNWTNGSATSEMAYTCTTPLPSGIGNITNDPQLTPSYRLKSTSPCIDAGTWSNAPATDIDGEARWDHPGHSNIVSIVDMGADEFVDTDSDDMADHWEAETLGSTTNSNGTADGDNDDLDDLGEYENSTDPGNPDTDADTMPDGWEVGNDLDPLADDASQDPDGDTMNNGGEYIADTDPRDADSVLAVVNVSPEQGGTRIDWKGGRAARQFLDFRPSLTATGAGWKALLAIPPPTPVTNAIVDLSTTNDVIFYRIRAAR